MAADNALTIQARIKTLMEAISGIGVVNTGIRWGKTAARQSTLFANPSDTAQIRAWFIVNSGADRRPLNNRDDEVIHTFEITGVLSHVDADESANTLRSLAGSVVSALADPSAWVEYANLALSEQPTIGPIRAPRVRVVRGGPFVDEITVTLRPREAVARAS